MPKWLDEAQKLNDLKLFKEGEFTKILLGGASEFNAWKKEHKDLLQQAMLVPDLGHRMTDQELAKLEKKISKEYQTAMKEMKAKLKDYKQKYEEQWYKAFNQYNSGEITKQEWDNWYKRHINDNQQLQGMIDVLSKDMHNANLAAHQIARGGMADIYALNGNYATYMIEQGGKIDTGFTLYNHDAAAALLKEKKQLMPGPSTAKAAEIKANKDMQWNHDKIQSACLQSVLQGESPYDLADRLMGIGKMNETAAIRYARTMTTSVQNMGRYDAFRRAKSLGVNLTCEWNAILDHATRHDHRMLHGLRRDVDEPFEVGGVKIYYPGQSEGPGASDIPQRMIWNCRCTIIAWVKGFEGETVKYNEAMGNMSFDEWQWEKAKTQPAKKSTGHAAPVPKQKPEEKQSKKKPKAKDRKFTQQENDLIKNAKEYSYDAHETENFDQQWWNSLTDEQRKGAHTYTKSKYEEMNGLLRGTESWSDYSSARQKTWKKLIDGCTEALNSRGLAEDTILYRGMGRTEDLALAMFGNKGHASQVYAMIKDRSIIGQSFMEKGFCSTGVSAADGWKKEVGLVIHAPKGTKGFYIDPVSAHPGEKEVLLQRGTIFKIFDAETTESGKITLHVLAQSAERITPIP